MEQNNNWINLFIAFLALGSNFKLLVFTQTRNNTTPSSDDANWNESDTVDWHISVCIDFYGAYVRKPDLGIVCCKNQSLFQPIQVVENWETNTKLLTCVPDFTHSDNEDLPISMWNLTSCIQKNSTSGPNRNSKITFDSTFQFMTRKYPKEISKLIEQASRSCRKDGDSIKGEPGKLMKYTECLHKAEKQVCHKPSKSLPDEPEDKSDKKFTCTETIGIRERDRKDYCCKGKSLPYNFLLFYQETLEDDDYIDEIDACEETFTRKQLQLDQKLKKEIEKYDQNFEVKENETDTEENNPRSKLYKCRMACAIRRRPYVAKSIRLDFDGMTRNLTDVFGKKVQNDLKSILVKQKSALRFLPEKLTFAELMKKFQKASENLKMKYYCELAQVLKAQVERALHEYCFDKEQADKWYSSHYHE